MVKGQLSSGAIVRRAIIRGAIIQLAIIWRVIIRGQFSTGLCLNVIYSVLQLFFFSYLCIFLCSMYLILFSVF